MEKTITKASELIALMDMDLVLMAKIIDIFDYIPDDDTSVDVTFSTRQEDGRVITKTLSVTGINARSMLRASFHDKARKIEDDAGVLVECYYNIC